MTTRQVASMILSVGCVWGLLLPSTSTADIEAIQRITLPNRCCMGHPGDDNLFDIQAPPFPFNDGSDPSLGPAGPGWLVNVFDIHGNPAMDGLTESRDFGYHNRTQDVVEDFVPDPAKTFIEYTFTDPLAIDGGEILQHHFGIAQLEGFLGDSPTSVSSIGLANADTRGPFAPEYKSVKFQFDNTTSGSFLRLIPTRIVHNNAFAVYRVFPTVDGERIVGAGPGPMPVGYVETVAFDNPVAYWRFEEDPASGTAMDASPKAGSQNGTYVGGVTSIAGLDGSVTGPDERTYRGLPQGNRALSFDGSTGRIDVPDMPAGVINSSGPLSIEFLLKNAQGGGTNQSILTKGSLSGPGILSIDRMDGRLVAGINTGSPETVSIPDPPADIWTHVVGTFQPRDGAVTDVSFYVDGELVEDDGNAKTIFGVQADNSGEPLTIGALQFLIDPTYVDYFSGALDEVAVYDRALSDTAVKAHYDALFVAPQEGFVRQPGDANQDKTFNSSDIIEVLAGGKYETGEPATWSEGDWNRAPDEQLLTGPPVGDGVFDSLDIIAALSTGLYETGPYAAGNRVELAANDAAIDSVPEPSTLLLGLGFSLLVACGWRGRRL